MEPSTGPDAHRPSRRRVIAAAVTVLIVAGVVAGGVLIAVRPPWLHDLKTTQQQVPVVGSLPGIVAAPTGLPAPQVVTPGATLPPVAPGATPNASFEGRADTIPLENRPEFAYEGSLDWQIHTPSEPGWLIEGYASAPSYFSGDTLKLAVSTTAPSYVATIWRVSGGAPADSPFVKVATIESTPGRQQAAAVVDPATKMVHAPWDVTTTFPIPADWPSGMYLVRLDSTEGVQSYVPFVLRSRSATTYLLVSSALNWEAYNEWGGSSVYVTRIGDPLPGVGRAYAVSFDRPYASDGGAGQLFFLELPFISWIEREGLDVSFTTDYDLSLDPASQPLPRAVIFNGHDEYWGVPLYDWLDSHVAAGDMGVAMLAADSGYWPISFGPATLDGPRSFVCLKTGPVPAALRPPGQTEEPSEAPAETLAPGETEERGGPGYVALGPDGPYLGAFADQPLFGVHYRGITSVLGRYSIVPSGADPRLLAGTGLAGNSSLGFIAGGEVDGVLPFAEWWGPLRGAYDHPFAVAAGLEGRLPSLRWTAEAVWRELPSGGRVFASGTFYWGWALDPAFASSHDVSPDFPRLTRNILTWLATGT
jgi:hypothetical protein